MSLSPTPDRLSIADLCARYGNEDAHTGHVTALALRLFDEARAWLDLTDADRALLDAAARLHDIGYSLDPIHHAELSASLVRRKGVRGFRDAQLPYIAGAMLLHSGKLRARLEHPVLAEAGNRRRVLQIGAFLRIADGLDYGHVQDSSLVGVHRKDGIVHVTVRAVHFPANVAQADRKADLWRSVYPLDIRFEAAVETPPRIQRFIRPEDHPIEAARRLLMLQYKKIQVNIDAAVAGEEIEPLHDIRVAIRRFRSLLETFRKHLPKRLVREIDPGLQLLGRALGPVRDLDVWVAFLQSDDVRNCVATHRGWPMFLHHQIELRRLALPTTRRNLRGRRYSAFRLKIGRLLRADLPALVRTRPAGSLEKLAAKALRKAVRRALRAGPLLHSTSPENLHQLRIRLRRARYLAEFFGPVLGPTVEELARRLRKTEQPLGRIHDVDLGLQRVQQGGPTPPRPLVALLQQRRQANLQAVHLAWRRWEARSFQSRLQARLKAPSTKTS